MLIGKLQVRIFRAEGLASADLNGKSDPYIFMRLVNQSHRTSTQYRTLNPVWNELFEFNIHDIHEELDFTVWDEDRHGADFLGRITVPLLSVKHKQVLWYQLKDKKLQQSVKGKVLMRLDIEWSLFKAGLRTFTPKEELVDPQPAVLKRSVMISNFVRAKTHIMCLVEFVKYIHSCFQWESKLRSLIAFILFVVLTYYFEPWMAPFGLLCLFVINMVYIKICGVRVFGKSNDTCSTLNQQTCGYLTSSENSLQTCNTSQQHQNASISTNDQTSIMTGESDKSLMDKFYAMQDIMISIQDVLGDVASYFERISNTFKFKVPYLSYLMMFCLFIASLLLYFVSVRYIILVWGINKFTKKLRNPGAIDNNELVDFLSRVPDDMECLKKFNNIASTTRIIKR